MSRPRRRPLRWLLLALLAWLAPVAPADAAARLRCDDCAAVGAARVPIRVPEGTPLGGYGSLHRRMVFPDVLGRVPHAFWFTPSDGERDPLMARAVVVEVAETRLAWITLDVVAIDGAFTDAVAARLERAGVRAGTLIVSASHTHSGPGAYVDSRLMGLVAMDLLDGDVRGALVEAAAAAVRSALDSRAPARLRVGSAMAATLTRSRLGHAVDPEVVVVGFTRSDASPVALIWNYAIHGTMLGARNRRLSGDVMGVASHEVETRVNAPALFVNGAVADVSPVSHGSPELPRVSRDLASTILKAWEGATPVAAHRLVTRRTRVPLPKPRLSLHNCLHGWVPRSLTASLGDAFPREAELTAVALGAVAWVTVPGELQTALGQRLKGDGRRLFRQAFVAGLSNDYLGYFISAADFDRPTYVTCASLYGPKAGELLTDRAIELLHELGGRR